MIPNVEFVYEFDGQRKRLRYRAVPMPVWSELKKQTGLTPKTLMAGILEDHDVEACVALVWLDERQKRRIPFGAVMAKVTAEQQFFVHDVLGDGESLFGLDAPDDDQTDDATDAEAVESPPTESSSDG